MEKKRIVVVGYGRGSGKSELQAKIAELQDKNTGCEIIILEGCPEPTKSQAPEIPDIKLIERNEPLYPKQENQPWSKGYRKELNRNKTKRY